MGSETVSSKIKTLLCSDLRVEGNRIFTYLIMGFFLDKFKADRQTFKSNESIIACVNSADMCVCVSLHVCVCVGVYTRVTFFILSKCSPQCTVGHFSGFRSKKYPYISNSSCVANLTRQIIALRHKSTLCLIIFFSDGFSYSFFLFVRCSFPCGW